MLYFASIYHAMKYLNELRARVREERLASKVEKVSKMLAQEEKDKAD